jgi:hypothetical protein
MSIIIVGVGNDQFAEMRVLDADQGSSKSEQIKNSLIIN